MAYAQLQDLINRVGLDALTQLVPTSSDPMAPAVLDATRIGAVLADASAEIDSYLGGRYTLPLSSVPAILTRLCCDMALYQLQALRPLGEIEDARRRHTDATRLLHAIGEGKISIGLDLAGDTPTENTASAIHSNEPTRAFSARHLRDYTWLPRF